MPKWRKFQRRKVDCFLNFERRIYNEGCRTNDASIEKIFMRRRDQFRLSGYKIIFFEMRLKINSKIRAV